MKERRKKKTGKYIKVRGMTGQKRKKKRQVRYAHLRALSIKQRDEKKQKEEREQSNK